MYFDHANDFEGEKYTFKTNEEFCEWIISKQHKNHTAIAHYSKGYDSYCVLKYCVDNAIKPYTIYSETKLMLLEIANLGLKIIDSMNFIAQPLASFPKTFGLHQLKKGYFTHYFNKPKNENYIGPIPNIRYYGANAMKPEQRETFLQWHQERANDVFNFRKELED